ncbi:MAG: methyltransferase domain-containing protein [Nitrospirae bacterium]|nr:MAG: methyltransferase domain-containing protein [Nitrospirota bacterium]
MAVACCQVCHLAQLTDLVPPERMFTEYLYFSSYSDSFLAHAREMMESLTARFALGPDSRVLEVASNDGYLLQYFEQRNIRVLGVEPAKNIAAEAERRGIPTLNCFFGLEAVTHITGGFGQADLIVGNNVLAHVPAINEFLRAVKLCLKPAGAAVFEFPYLKDLFDGVEFDTIYHEHVFYYSLAAIEKLAERAGLQLFDVMHRPVHGGSLRVFLQHRGTYPVTGCVAEYLAAEQASGLTGPERYASFSREVVNLKEELRSLLCGLKAAGKRLAAYGAPAKGNTLLNYCGIGTELVEFTVDRSPHKQGLLTPGARLPIHAPEALLKEMPDYTLVLPWNLAEEIVAQQQEYRRRGGRFIVAIPKPGII